MSKDDLSAKQISVLFGGSFTLLIVSFALILVYWFISDAAVASRLDLSASFFLIGFFLFLGFAVAVITAPASIAAYAAEAKGYKPLPWFLLGLICSWGAVLGVIAMPSKYFRF